MLTYGNPRKETIGRRILFDCEPVVRVLRIFVILEIPFVPSPTNVENFQLFYFFPNLQLFFPNMYWKFSQFLKNVFTFEALVYFELLEHFGRIFPNFQIHTFGDNLNYEFFYLFFGIFDKNFLK